MKYTKLQRLAIAQALYNLAGQIVSTKDPDSLRSEIDGFYKTQYDLTGSKSFDITMGDEQWGTYSLKFSKEKPQETRYVMEVSDYIALAEWYSHVPEEYVRKYIGRDLQPFAEYYFAETGELPDGCVMDEIVVLAQPKQYIGGVLKIDLDKILTFVKKELPQADIIMLGDGE